MSNQETACRQCAPGELWQPGLDLDNEYPTLTEEELEKLWAGYNPPTEAHALKSVYGVYSEPQEVRAIASIDLCEVVRDTAIGLDAATGIQLGRRGIYSKDTWFAKDGRGLDYEASVVVSVVRTIMDAGLIKPVEHIAGIRALLQNWRANGIYCIANTSTLPGCERGTIEHTLERDLKGCFDALVLPRNHDGSGSMTKAAALHATAEELGLDLGTLPFVHIDDANHHIASFQNYYDGTAYNFRLLVPRHSDNEAITGAEMYDSPWEAFLGADRYFTAEGARS